MSSDDDAMARRGIHAVRDNIARVRRWTDGKGLAELRADRMLRYAVERAFMAIDAAIRDSPEGIVIAHRLPARPIAGFRNAPAHSYDDILDERVVLTIRDDLPALDAQRLAILGLLDAGSRG